MPYEHRRGKRWTAVEENDLIANYRLGMTPTELAFRMNRTADTVIRRLERLGYVLRRGPVVYRLEPWADRYGRPM